MLSKLSRSSVNQQEIELMDAGKKLLHLSSSSIADINNVLAKHGDIAAECLFKTDSMRSSILEVVCEVVRRVQTNDVIEKMEEIESQVSDAEAANIDVSWLRPVKSTVC
ncbi:hypothetical protein L1987_22839 [Smallanthus sonchifolius]|uniref:Uncharacterized protein n=1 Tax=Smallanthus sonchifolius TaxID=185202 RepID=A0ACB9IHF4_9ASTR|nr:hypothetical protein L1987_22839 [Smallanthus sonchifolius]